MRGLKKAWPTDRLTDKVIDRGAPLLETMCIIKFDLVINYKPLTGSVERKHNFFKGSHNHIQILFMLAPNPCFPADSC